MNSIYYICKNRVNLFQDGTIVWGVRVLLLSLLSNFIKVAFELRRRNKNENVQRQLSY